MNGISDFVREEHIVREFRDLIAESANEFSIDRIALEFNHSCGKTDIVGKTHDGELVAFEAKVSKWRTAVIQAYRNSAFANYSYVLLPLCASRKALQARHEFTMRGIGLCSISAHGIAVEIQANWKKPIQPWITASALRFIDGDNDERQIPPNASGCH